MIRSLSRAVLTQMRPGWPRTARRDACAPITAPNAAPPIYLLPSPKARPPCNSRSDGPNAAQLPPGARAQSAVGADADVATSETLYRAQDHHTAKDRDRSCAAHPFGLVCGQAEIRSAAAVPLPVRAPVRGCRLQLPC